MKYYFRIQETRTAVVEVEADSADEALERVADAYVEDTICLDDKFYIDERGAEFYDETDMLATKIKQGYPVYRFELDQ